MIPIDIVQINYIGQNAYITYSVLTHIEHNKWTKYALLYNVDSITLYQQANSKLAEFSRHGFTLQKPFNHNLFVFKGN